MKDVLKKGLTCACAAALCLTAGVAAVGCRSASSIEIDPNRTQLYVSVYGGGVGTEWFNHVVEGFEEYTKDMNTFEEGKSGVQIVPEINKTTTAGSAILTNIANSGNDVFFTEGAYYYDFVSQNKLAPINDVVTEPLTEFGENKTIESKMDQALQDFYKAPDNNYYALPFYDGFYGIIYNVDFFEDQNLYFAADYRDADSLDMMFVESVGEERSLGPDGRTGVIEGIDYSADDGLPATYEDFYRLCERIVDLGHIPLIWPGMYPYITSYVQYQMWADYEGRDQFYLNFSFYGMAKDLINVSDNGEITELPETKIDNSKGAMLQKQRGKYEVLKFMENIMHPEDPTDRFYHNLAFSPSLSNTDSQSTFLASIVSTDNSQIAMLMDGNWWEEEADSVGAFNSLVSYGYNREDMRFGFMPFPKATDGQVGNTPRTVVSVNDSMCMINAKTTGVRLEIAKMFLRYCHTDAAMQQFTIDTGMTKPFNYELTDTQESQLTYFGKEMYALKSPERDTDIVYPYSDNQIFLDNFSQFHPYYWGFVIDGSYTPAESFRSGMSAEEYFRRMYTYQQPRWASWYEKL